MQNAISGSTSVREASPRCLSDLSCLSTTNLYMRASPSYTKEINTWEMFNLWLPFIFCNCAFNVCINFQVVQVIYQNIILWNKKMRQPPRLSHVCLDKYPKYSPLSEHSIEKSENFARSPWIIFSPAWNVSDKGWCDTGGEAGLGHLALTTTNITSTTITTTQQYHHYHHHADHPVHHHQEEHTTTANTKLFFLAKLRVKWGQYWYSDAAYVFSPSLTDPKSAWWPASSVYNV